MRYLTGAELMHVSGTPLLKHVKALGGAAVSPYRKLLEARVRVADKKRAHYAYPFEAVLNFLEEKKSEALADLASSNRCLSQMQVFENDKNCGMTYIDGTPKKYMTVADIAKIWGKDPNYVTTMTKHKTSEFHRLFSTRLRIQGVRGILYPASEVRAVFETRKDKALQSLKAYNRSLDRLSEFEADESEGLTNAEIEETKSA